MKVVVGLGSNLGDREEYLRRALELMCSFVDPRPVVSQIYRSQALDEDGKLDKLQEDFLNAVCLLESQASPMELLESLFEIESRLGRKARQGPRTIDLDILAVDDYVIDSLGLQVPHPRMCQRDFVLLPFCEVYPDWIHPSYDKSATELLQDLEGHIREGKFPRCVTDCIGSLPQSKITAVG